MRHTRQTENVVAVRVREQKMVGSRKLFFLFTAGQVEEVLSEIVLRPVPFAPSFLQGIALWHDHLLPVIDLEKRFAFEGAERAGKGRFLVVRTGVQENPEGEQLLRCVLHLSDEIRIMAVSDAMVKSNGIDVDPSLIRGTYRWKQDMYIVPDLVSIVQNHQPAVGN